MAEDVVRAGQGPREALMLHCSLAHKGAWAAVTERLGDLLTMTAFDLPGHGAAPDWDGRGDYQAVCLARATELCSGPTDLIGHSFGATVALRLAVERPDLVRSLVLVEPVFFAAARAAGSPEFDRMTRESAPAAAAMQAGETRRATRLFTDLWGAGRPWDDLPQGQRAYMTDRMHLVYAESPAIEEDNAGLLAPGRLEAVACPVTLIRGARTHPVIGAVHAELCCRIAGSSDVALDGAAHMAPVTHPGPVADAIRAHLRR